MNMMMMMMIMCTYKIASLKAGQVIKRHKWREEYCWTEAMAFRLKTLHLALLMTFMAFQCHAAPLEANDCQDAFSRLKSIMSVLILQTEHLLREYMAFHGLNFLPTKMPDYAVKGFNFSEQLQDIYSQNVVFNQHIQKVEHYQIEDWGNPENVAEPLYEVKGSFRSHTAILIQMAQQLYPEVVLTTVQPQHEIHNHGWAKKSYGRKVIVGLKNWLANVQKVLEVTQGPCDNHTAEAQQA
ncbi:uncharacterized protein LOC133499810 [Syngnathoides biaculeatus]|uniref:uncharacterized protein LOC133499810 n=1 Tax=Syngnathoides biaculeatus TaxID=300417 RepID=UPI002ADD67AF|nr:uncharacterized protein LOC133499810 [Syngnathoides biaculeatus]